MKLNFTNRIGLAGLMLVLFTAGRATGTETVLLGDQFLDNQRSNQALPGSAQWFYSGISNATERLWVTPPPSSGQQMRMVAQGGAGAYAQAQMYFTAAGSPQSLAPGDSIAFDFIAKFDALNDAVSDFRVALFNSAGLTATNRPTGDSEAGVFAATNTAIYLNTHSGYILTMNTGATNAASANSLFNIYERNNQGNSTAFSIGTQMGTLNQAVLNLKVKQFFPVHLRYTRSSGAGTSVTIDATVNGVTISRTDTASILTNFDGCGFQITDTALASGQALTVDNMTVTYVTVGGVTNTLVSDSFADGERVTQALPNSAKWFYTGQAVATNRLTCAGPVSAQTLVFTPGGSDAMALAYLTPSGSPQSLAVGESITYQASVHLDALLNAPNGIRFGLFNSGGVRTNADNQSGIDASTTYTNYTGYSVWFNPGANDAFNLYRRAAGSGAHPFSTSANTLMGASNTNNLGLTTSLSMIPRFSMTITRLSTGIQIEAAINGRNVVRTEASPVTTSFDTIAIFASGAALYDGPQITLDTVDVIYANAIATVPSSGKIFSQTFEGTPWTSPTFVGTQATGSVSSSAFGTINVLGSVTPSTGMRLDVNSTGLSNYWSGALNSGLIPVANTETNLGKLTLAFDLQSSAVREIRVRLESADAGGVVSGTLEKYIYPAVYGSFQRFTFELSDMTNVSGTFSPTAPNVKLSYLIEGGVDAGSWPAGTNWLQVDNIYYAKPSYYVKPGGNDGLDGHTEATAFATIAQALSVASVGDIVDIMDGGLSTSYTLTSGLSFSRGGSPGGWVTLKNYPGQRPLILRAEPTGGSYDTITMTKGSSGNVDTTSSLNYIEIRGLRWSGTADTLATTNRGASNAASNLNGISASGRYMVKCPHHLRFADNEVYNFSAGGIGCIDSDWFFVENNDIHDNSNWTIYGTSGLSQLTPANFDGTAGGYRTFWLNNRSYRNETKEPWVGIGAISDGNGAILDTFLNTRHGPFLGRAIVANNQCYENGGSGIHALYVNGADIVNNTTVRNSHSPALSYPNLFTVGANDFVIANNIIVASSNKPINNVSYSSDFPQTTGVKFLNNIYKSDGSTVAPYVGAGDSGNITTSNPGFVNEATGVNDYRLTTNSPAFNAALATVNVLPLRDNFGILRGTDGFPDIGACEGQPAIVTPPLAQTNVVGADVTFSLVAQSGGTNSALTYQWQLTGTNLVGATNSSLTVTNLTVAQAGNYRAVVSVGSPIFNTVTSVVATLNVNKQTPLIGTLPTTTAITYGQTLGSSILGSGNVTNTAGATVPGNFVFALSGIMPKAGMTNVQVNFTPTDSANYNTNTATVTVTVNLAPLGVTASNANAIYNGVAFSGGNGVTYSGFVNGDTSASLGGSTNYGGTSQGAIAAGSYSLVPSGLTSADYAISYTNGTLTIGKAGPTVGLVSSANPSAYNGAVYFTATLPADATGSVIFSTVAGAFSTNALTSGNASSLTITNLPSGANAITASYLGDGNYFGSTNTLNQVVGQPPAIAPVLSDLVFTNNQFQFTLTGTAGSNYVVQAVTDLPPANWLSLITNTSPFVFTETNANAFDQRFYRGAVAP